MNVTPRYPLFVIFQDVGQGYMPIVAHSDNGDCFLAYQTQELAELYIEQAKNVAMRPGDKYKPERMDEEEFKSMLRQNDDVALVGWNNMVQAQTFVFLPVADILG